MGFISLDDCTLSNESRFLQHLVSHDQLKRLKSLITSVVAVQVVVLRLLVQASLLLTAEVPELLTVSLPREQNPHPGFLNAQPK